MTHWEIQYKTSVVSNREPPIPDLRHVRCCYGNIRWCRHRCQCGLPPHSKVIDDRHIITADRDQCMPGRW